MNRFLDAEQKYSVCSALKRNAMILGSKTLTDSRWSDSHVDMTEEYMSWQSQITKCQITKTHILY